MSNTAVGKDEQIVRNVSATLTERYDRTRRNSVSTSNERRSRTLASLFHKQGTARFVALLANGTVLYRVPADTRTDDYTIIMLPDGTALCDCAAGAHGRPCKHAGAAFYAGDAMWRALAVAACRVAGREQQLDAWRESVAWGQ